MVGVADGEEVGLFVVGDIVGLGVTTLATGAPVGIKVVAVPVGASVGSKAISGASVGASASSVGAGVSGKISMGGAIGQDVSSPSEMQTMPGQAGHLARHWLVSTTHWQFGFATQSSQVVVAVHSWPTAARETVSRRSAEISFIVLFASIKWLPMNGRESKAACGSKRTNIKIFSQKSE